MRLMDPFLERNRPRLVRLLKALTAAPPASNAGPGAGGPASPPLPAPLSLSRGGGGSEPRLVAIEEHLLRALSRLRKEASCMPDAGARLSITARFRAAHRLE
jgi:hypothetical protein